MESQEPTGCRSQNDPHPEVESSFYQFPNSIDSDPEKASHMVTIVQEKIPFSFLGTSSGKQRKARSSSQPQFRSENNPATIEADQILLALETVQLHCKYGAG